ncbi:MAG: hypothetical protein L6R42_008132 [Xanthoria sp. 1 TBL-2021]|nr:MAG: hypothetical protein L6R42_008132 [Xanthoria sp. 1 TBL-2021]
MGLHLAWTHTAMLDITKEFRDVVIPEMRTITIPDIVSARILSDRQDEKDLMDTGSKVIPWTSHQPHIQAETSVNVMGTGRPEGYEMDDMKDVKDAENAEDVEDMEDMEDTEDSEDTEDKVAT